MTESKLDVERVLRESALRPWSIAEDDGELMDANGCREQYWMTRESVASDQLKVLAVNSYEPLREALAECIQALEGCKLDMLQRAFVDWDGIEFADVALAKAREVMG